MNQAEIQIFKHFREQYIKTESEVHFEKSKDIVESFFGAFLATSRYEDGLATRNFRGFDSDLLFREAYRQASQISAGGHDPHIRWRCLVLARFLRWQLPCDVLELGVGKGFMFQFAIRYLSLKGISLEGCAIYLVDKFDEQAVDSTTGQVLIDKVERYAMDVSSVISGFSSFSNVNVIQGVVPDVLHSLETNLKNIGFIHCDLNAAQTEVDALRLMIPRLVKGCVILLDDYGFPEFAVSQKLHDQLSQELGYEILALPTGQGLIHI